MSIKELAEKLGVSTCTVSLALSGKKGVSEETRRRVVEAAARFGYHPDNAGRMLRSGKSFQIGVAIPAPLDDFYARMIFLLQQELAERGFMPLFAMWGTDTRSPHDAFEMLARSKLDGLISWVNAPELAQFSCPVVLHRQNESIPLLDSIGLDHAHMICEMVAHLQRQGCRRIGYVGNLEDVRAVVLRRELLEKGLECREEFFLRMLPKDAPLFSQKFRDFSSRKELPDALAVTSDSFSLRINWFLQQHRGWRPRLISLCDSELLSQSVPQVSGFSLCEEQQAFHLVDLLMQRMRDPERAVQHLLLQPKFCIRESKSTFPEQ